MKLFPAIDLKDGQVVRLVKGEFSTAHPVAGDAVETARAFKAAGAQWVHMVDLDGARSGPRQNGAIVAAVAAAGEAGELTKLPDSAMMRMFLNPMPINSLPTLLGEGGKKIAQFMVDEYAKLAK